MNRPAAAPRFPGAAFAAALAFLALSGFHFLSITPSGTGDRWTPSEHDTIQAARYFAQTGRLGTHVLRPLLTDRIAANADGTLPDMAHPPLYTVFAAGAMRAFHQTAPGQGGREAVLVSLLAFVLSVGACGLLARCFGPGTGLLACAFYAVGSARGVGFVFAPSPIALGSLLLTLLFLVLYKLDAAPMPGEAAPKSLLWLAGLAGGVCGLLFLTVYSTLILLPLFCAYLWRVSGREKATVLLAFASVWLLVCGPYLVRNVRLTRSSVFNSRLFEIMMHQPKNAQTDTHFYEDANLYHEADLPQTFTRFAARGGVVRVLSKTANTFAELVSESPVTLGVFVLPMFLGAALSRFPHASLDRLRNLGYAALLLHLVGAAFFLPAGEAAVLFRLYAPLASCVSAAFLFALLRARNLPVFYARATLWAWTTLACAGGVAALLGVGQGEPDFAPRVFYALNQQSPELAALRNRQNAFLLSNEPERAADFLGFPVALLPSDSRSVEALQSRMGKAAGGIILTPALDRPTGEIAPSALVPWAQLYRPIVQLRNITSVLDAKTRRSVVQQKQVFYPQALSAAMRSFPRPVPQAEQGGETTLIFWNPQAFEAGITAGGEQEP